MSDTKSVSNKAKEKLTDTAAWLPQQKPAAPKMDIRSVTIIALLCFSVGAYGMSLNNEQANSKASTSATAPASAEGN